MISTCTHTIAGHSPHKDVGCCSCTAQEVKRLREALEQKDRALRLAHYEMESSGYCPSNEAFEAVIEALACQEHEPEPPICMCSTDGHDDGCPVVTDKAGEYTFAAFGDAQGPKPATDSREPDK